MGIAEFMSRFIEDTISNLVDFKEEVAITTSITTKLVLIQVKTNKCDIGKVIGKNGRTINALSIICLAAKNTKYPDDPKGLSIEILED